MRGRCTLKFIPFPKRDELVIKVPHIVYKCQEYNNFYPGRGRYG